MHSTHLFIAWRVVPLWTETLLAPVVLVCCTFGKTVTKCLEMTGFFLLFETLMCNTCIEELLFGGAARISTPVFLIQANLLGVRTLLIATRRGTLKYYFFSWEVTHSNFISKTLQWWFWCLKLARTCLAGHSGGLTASVLTPSIAGSSRAFLGTKSSFSSKSSFCTLLKTLEQQIPALEQ